MKIKILFIVWLILSSTVLIGQDPYFFVSENKVRGEHPASLSLQEKPNEFRLGYRSQWGTIAEPYRNIMAAFSQSRSAVAYGLTVYQNGAGKTSLQTTGLGLKLSYKKRLSGHSEWLAIGAAGYLLQRRFQAALLQFESQYIEGTGFNASLDSGENFLRTTQLIPSLGVGVLLKKNIAAITFTGGLSLSHLLRPASGFYAFSEERLPLKISTFSVLHIPLIDKVTLDGLFFYNQSRVAQEIVLGGRFNYRLSKQNEVFGGASYRIKDAFILEAGLKYKNSTFHISYDTNNSPLSKIISSGAAIELGATFGFSGRKNEILQPIEELTIPLEKKNGELDSDKDGVIDKLDECPFMPGKVYLNGCLDTDKDGIWDHLDACPNLYGDRLNQGCPMKYQDSDKDGIRDDIDKCPYVSGLPELGGCMDTDQDGISDLEDYCPFLKGVKSNNGCPEMGKREHQYFMKERSVSAIVEFDTDKSYIKPRFYADLDEVIGFVKRKNRSKIYISGHTDDEGDSLYNYELGKKRSEAVFEYFIQNNISPQMMKIVSYGEHKPKETNSNNFGKARNRRVEVFVVDE